MRILVVNPNTSTSVTDLIAAEATRAASPGTEIVTAQARRGVAYIETRFESLLAAPEVAELIAEHDQDVDAVVVAAFGDPGMPALKECTDVPVVGITESALAVAGLLAPRFSILAISRRIAPWYRDAVRVSGLEGRLASIRSLQQPLRDIGTVGEDFGDRFVEMAHLAIEEDGADAIILAGAPLAGLARELGDQIPVPLVDGVFSGVRMAETLAAAPRSQARAGSTCAPPVKPRSGLSPALDGLLARHQQTQQEEGT